jgi:hypothetical protein
MELEKSPPPPLLWSREASETKPSVYKDLKIPTFEKRHRQTKQYHLSHTLKSISQS